MLDKLTCNVVCWSWDKLTCNVVCWSWDKLTCNVVCWSWDKLTCNVVCWSWDKLTCNVVCLAAFSPCDRCHSSLIVLACVPMTGRGGGRGLSESTSGTHTMTLYATTMSLACPLLPLCPIASTA